MIKSYNTRDNSVEVCLESGSAKTIPREPIVDEFTPLEKRELGLCTTANCPELATHNFNTWCKEHWDKQKNYFKK